MKSPLADVAEVETINGIRALNLESSIVHCLPSLFQKNSIDVRTALMLVKDASQLLSMLLNGGHSKIAGRLVGAYRNSGQEKMANDLLKTMKSAGYDVRESDPFASPTSVALSAREASPYANRIRLLWKTMRSAVLNAFPVAPGISEDHETTLLQIKDLYTTDAYHSLSIEKYTVSAALIARVRTGAWNVSENESDRNQKDAMAARGYWESSNAVEKSIIKILNGENAGAIADAEHGDWYRALFSPSVATGILKPADLAGYRAHQVYIGNSQHVPLSTKSLRDAMPVLFELLEEEPEESS